MSVDKTIALAGNPNVGKSTLFNAMTGMRQHTGNWTGKTVGCAQGKCKIGNCSLKMIDLPGTYSLNPHSEEERLAGDIIHSDVADVIVVVCDATCLERNLILALQILSVTPRVVLCVNLMDEAKKKGIDIDIKLLEKCIGVPAVGICARHKKEIKSFVEFLSGEISFENAIRPDSDAHSISELARDIACDTVRFTKTHHDSLDRKIDKILTSKCWGFPIMFILLSAVLWLTVSGANLPSEYLSRVLFVIQDKLIEFMELVGAPSWLIGALILGAYRTLAWVVSVMLPPMAIFFPLFTILEDLGYLPRIAFNLDKCFKKCDACGKQALTM